MEERPPIWRVAANILNKQSRTADKGWSSSFGVERGSAVPRNFVRRGLKNSVEDRENEDLGAVAP